MHILFLTDNFPPEVNAPASRTYEHCRQWVRAGHHVTIITCAPNFPKGEVYVGYRNRLWQRERMENIDVIRVWTYITANEGFIKRTLDYLSYMVSAVFAAPFIHKVDLVVSTSPQIFTACAGYVVSRYKCTPFIFELRDLWPETIKAVGAMGDSFVYRLLEKLEMFLYRRAIRIVSVTESFKRVLIERGIEEEKIGVITNGVDTARFRPLPKEPALVSRFKLEGKFVAGYIGTLGLCHGLDTILAAAETMKSQEGNSDVRFVMLGDGAQKAHLKQTAERLGLDNVIFIDSVPKDEVPAYWSLLDVTIIHLKKDKLFTTVIPSKLFESMAMGIPVLHGVKGESAMIVEQHRNGLVFEPENAEQLCEHLLALKDDSERLAVYKANAIEAAKSYDRTALADKMLRLIESTMVPGYPTVTGARAKPREGAGKPNID